MTRSRRAAIAVGATFASVAVAVAGSGPAQAATTPVTPRVVITAPVSVKSEATAPIVVTVTPPAGSAAGKRGIAVRLQIKLGPTWTTLAVKRTDARGQIAFPVHVWQSTPVRALTTATGDLVAVESASIVIRAIPFGRVIATPRGAAPPPIKLGRAAPEAVGNGANARVYWVPNDVWASMVGVSWTPGCTPRTTLRYITVNYWGFDGFRYRGALIVRANLATKFAAALTDLYGAAFPIRSMVLPDRWGRTPGGYPGANDYATMAADNTSAFNCRFADGAEGTGRWSTHATGGSIDVNPWENPDSAGRPDSWFLIHRRTSELAILSEGSSAVRAFTTRGFVWGGNWGSVDFQHFEE